MIRIILGDDHAVIRRGLRLVLEEQEDFEVVGEANDGREAVSLVENLKPDVAVLDITMPNMNGLEAMRKIFTIDPGAKVIMCSALGQQNLIVEAIKAGVKDFIVKPFKPERILSAIEKALRA